MQGNPPFVVGDKVIRIGASYPEWNMYKGGEYVIDSIFWCCDHYGWKVVILGTEHPNCVSSKCEHCRQNNPVATWLAKLFVKADEGSEYTVESLLEELSEVKEPVLV
jgi:hypothetical protein